MSAAPAPEVPPLADHEADPRARQLTGLANLLLLERRLREAASLDEIGYVLVNDTAMISPYRIALWWRSGRKARLQAISGLPTPTRQAPFTAWAERLCRHLEEGAADGAPRPIEPGALPPSLAQEWGEYFPAAGLWLPLIAPGETREGALLLLRETPFGEAEQRLLAHWAAAGAHAVQALPARRLPLWQRWRQGLRLPLWLAPALLLPLLWLPVSLTTLGPAEVVPKDPLVIRAPLNGVIGEVLVQPNAEVRSGEVLLRLDESELKTQLDVAEQDLAIAEAEYRSAQQAAVGDRESSALLPTLQARIEQRRAEVAYLQARLARIEIVAPTAGIAIVPEAETLEGRPVAIGERLLTLADPQAVALNVWLGVGANIPLPAKTRIELFLNVRPERPVAARLRSGNYHATETPNGGLGYRLVADFVDTSQPPRIGWRGTAKVYGETVPLYYYLLRRPWATVRQWTGW